MVSRILNRWSEWRKSKFIDEEAIISERDQKVPEFKGQQLVIQRFVEEILRRYQEEIPSFSPHYLGHMFSEISLPAILGHTVAMLHNSNLVSMESSRVGTKIEREAIEDLCQMLGWKNECFGHFTSGGTIANYEAIIRARLRFKKLFPSYSGRILVGRHRHYSWTKAISVLGLDPNQIVQIELDENGRVCVESLIQVLNQIDQQGEKVMMLVSVMGTTESGTFDPTDLMQNALKDVCDYKVWHHVDAAYGGFLCSVKPSEWDAKFKRLWEIRESLKSIQSITLDPHKLAYVPYSCGAFLCQEREDYTQIVAHAPYLEFDPALDVGKFSIEGSRAGTGPTAMWVTSKAFGLNPEGLGRLLRRTVFVKDEFKKLLVKTIPNLVIIDQPENNILCLVYANPDEKLSVVNSRLKQVHRENSSQKNNEFILSQSVFHKRDYSRLISKTIADLKIQDDQDQMVVLRFCMMNPFIMTKETSIPILEKVTSGLKKALQEH